MCYGRPAFFAGRIIGHLAGRGILRATGAPRFSAPVLANLFDFALEEGEGGLYGRRPVAPPPPLPLCRGLATAVGLEAETIESDKNVSNPKIKESENRGGEGPRSGCR